jgi:hypothetical protein
MIFPASPVIITSIEKGEFHSVLHLGGLTFHENREEFTRTKRWESLHIIVLQQLTSEAKIFGVDNVKHKESSLSSNPNVFRHS